MKNFSLLLLKYFFSQSFYQWSFPLLLVRHSPWLLLKDADWVAEIFVNSMRSSCRFSTCLFPFIESHHCLLLVGFCWFIWGWEGLIVRQGAFLNEWPSVCPMSRRGGVGWRTARNGGVRRGCGFMGSRLRILTWSWAMAFIAAFMVSFSLFLIPSPSSSWVTSSSVLTH